MLCTVLCIRPLCKHADPDVTTMNLRTAERVATAVDAKPFALRQSALIWAKVKGRDAASPRDIRARAQAVADTIHADMAARDRANAAAYASR